MKHFSRRIPRLYHSTLLVVSALLAVAVNAAEPLQPWLQQLQHQQQKATFISANFRQEKQVKFISKPLVSQGQWQFADQMGLNWQVEHPFFARTLFLPDGVFKITANGQISQEQDPATLAIADLLQSLFSGQWQSLTDKFDVGAGEILDNERWQVTLTASDPWVSKAVQSIRLQGKQNQYHIEQIIVRDAQDNLTTITLSDWLQQSTPLSDAQRQWFSVD